MTSDDVLSLSTSILFVKLELGFGMSGEVKAVACSSLGKWEFSIILSSLLGRQMLLQCIQNPTQPCVWTTNTVACRDSTEQQWEEQLFSLSSGYSVPSHSRMGAKE